MQPEYLARLSGPVQEFIREVEGKAHLDIEVVLDSTLNNGGPLGQGNLAVDVTARRIQLFAPTNGYFPDGAVRHEVLHVQRFHVDGVPKLALVDGTWDKRFRDVFAGLDNAVEHIVIVPVELQFHPERRTHWEALMSDVVAELPSVPEGELRLAVCLHWTFLRHVLPGSPQIEIARNFMNEHTLAREADAFADQFLSVAASKEEMVRILFLTFPEIPKYCAALEFVNSVTGTHQAPIP